MNATNTSKRTPERKQLADQLDRFDALLDGLSEGLMGAITDAVRDGTRLAVKDAIVEILTDPALRAKLHQAAAPEPAAPPAPTEPKPSFWSRLKNAAASALASVGNAVNSVVSNGRQVAAVVAAVRDPFRVLRWIGDLKRLLTVAAAVGLTAATLSLLAPHVVSAAVSGIASGVAAVAVQVSLWTRRAVHVLAMA